jgi:hypothetical protein
MGRVKFEMTEVSRLFWSSLITGLTVILLQKMLQPCGPPPRKEED